MRETWELLTVVAALGAVPWLPLFLVWGLGFPAIGWFAAFVWAGCWYSWLALQLLKPPKGP